MDGRVARRVDLKRWFSDQVEIVTESGCWIWMLSLGTGKYRDRASVRIGGRSGRKVLVNRLAWRLFRGEIPDGLCVLHHCDVGCCVNPSHLWLGTQTDNMRDASRKDRLGPYSKLKFHPKREAA